MENFECVVSPVEASEQCVDPLPPAWPAASVRSAQVIPASAATAAATPANRWTKSSGSPAASGSRGSSAAMTAYL